MKWTNNFFPHVLVLILKIFKTNFAMNVWMIFQAHHIPKLAIFPPKMFNLLKNDANMVSVKNFEPLFTFFKGVNYGIAYLLTGSRLYISCGKKWQVLRRALWALKHAQYNCAWYPGWGTVRKFILGEFWDNFQKFTNVKKFQRFDFGFSPKWKFFYFFFQKLFYSLDIQIRP